MQSACYIDGQIPARSQGLTEKGFATHHRPGGKRWAIEVGPLLDSRRVAGPSAAVLISALIHHDL